MVKIKEYKIQRQGIRGIAIAMPKVWVDDNLLSPGDVIEFYRDSSDRLILVPKKQSGTDGDAA